MKVKVKYNLICCLLCQMSYGYEYLDRSKKTCASCTEINLIRVILMAVALPFLVMGTWWLFVHFSQPALVAIKMLFATIAKIYAAVILFSLACWIVTEPINQLVSLCKR
ncbi:MAG: hypothetical protein WC619_02395 [Patescibacteria group bacterium]